MHKRVTATVLSLSLLLTTGLFGVQAQAQTAVEKKPMAAAASLKLIGRTDLPKYTGDFDHFEVDVKGNRLFLAGEDGASLEVFNLQTGEHLKSIPGFDAPHVIHYDEKTNRLIVSDHGKSMTKILDGSTYKIIDTIKLVPGADAMEYDPSTNHVWIVSGGKNAEPKMKEITVSEVDVATGKVVGDLKFDTDFTEAMAFEQKGNRAFINVAGKSYVAVVDKKTRKLVTTWPIKEGENNSAIGLDEPNHRLFVVTRKPFKLVILNTDTGASVASFNAPGRTNGLLFDKANHRIYLTGDDHIAVFQQKDADHYEELASVASAKGAKTGILVPELNRVFVAVSPGDATGGAVLRYEVAH